MDVKSIFTTLDAHGVKYVLVGALGAIAHGAKLDTGDVDICIATDGPNLKRTAAALREMQAYLIREPATRPLSSIDLGDWRSLRLDDPSEHHLFATPFGEIDVLPEPFGPDGWGATTNYTQLARQAVKVKAFGLAIPVAGFEDIKSSKLALGREQDVAAETELVRVSRLVGRRESLDFGLEQFATRTTRSSIAMGFLTKMAAQTDRVAGPAMHCETPGEGISGSSVCHVRFANLTAVLKFTVPATGATPVERARRELAFYRDLAGRVPVRVPQLLDAYSGPEGIALIMQEYQPSPPPDHWQETEYLEAARQLAHLHAAFWGKAAGLAGFTWLKREQPGEIRKDAVRAAGYWQSLREQPRFARLLPEQTFRWILGLLSRYETGDEIAPDLPLTLCHGDFHAANLLKDSEGRFVWVDWQEVGPAQGPEDLSFFIQRASAEAEIPRDRMLEEYCDELRRAIDEDVSLHAIRQVVEAAELRSYLLYWPAFMTQAREERLRAMLERIRSLAV